MKTTFTYAIPVVLSILLFTSCVKSDYVVAPVDEYEWMRSHDQGIVAYVDYHTGNYIVETYNGYSVMESWGGITPAENDTEYAWFSNRGVQNIYNRDGDYFTKARVVDSWLSWSDALYVLDNINY